MSQREVGPPGTGRALRDVLVLTEASQRVPGGEGAAHMGRWAALLHLSVLLRPSSSIHRPLSCGHLPLPMLSDPPPAEGLLLPIAG